jgi:elongation factor Ts
MADCKKALEEANGDMEGAIEILRKKGAATAAKRADKAANEGVVATAVSADQKRAAIVEVNCETDFVARNDEFGTFARELANYILEHEPADYASLLQGTIGGKTVQNWLDELLGKYAERIEIKRFDVLKSDAGFVAHYVHHGDKLGVLIELTDGADPEKTSVIARDIAMQVAAMNPTFVHRGEVPQEVLDKEKEILREQTVNEGKKPEFADKIVAGRIEKFFGDACLIEQSFVKDSSKLVRDVLAEFSKESGKDVNVSRFIRYNLGEVSNKTEEPAEQG